MKRAQKLGWYSRGRRGRGEEKRATRRAERTEAKQRLKNPEALAEAETKHKRRYFGWDY